METWKSCVITGDLNEVPGIGPAAIKRLSDKDLPDDDRVTNTYQLFGAYLRLRGPDDEDDQVDSFAHNGKFWHWLQFKGITAHRSAVVRAVAEKLAPMFPGLYDPSIYESDDESDEE